MTSLIQLAEDSVVVARQLRFEVEGELGEVPAEVATPLAVVLAELLQNAIEHAFLDEDGVVATEQGQIHVFLEGNDTRLVLVVSDNGSGLPEGFDIDQTQSLGLSIVRDLVRSQLDGSIAMSRQGTGTEVRIELPVPEARRIG